MGHARRVAPDQRAVGTVVGVLLLAKAWCGQASAPATWLAAGLVLVAMRLHPPTNRDGNLP